MIIIQSGFVCRTKTDVVRRLPKSIYMWPRSIVLFWYALDLPGGRYDVLCWGNLQARRSMCSAS